MNRPERNFTTEHIRLERRLPSYWRVTFDIPPVNIFGPKELPQLNDIITAIERDEQVKVVVFDSAVEGFFITHYDFLAPLERRARIGSREHHDRTRMVRSGVCSNMEQWAAAGALRHQQAAES